MDGNGRWAKKRALPRAVGHQRGVEAAQALLPDGPHGFEGRRAHPGLRQRREEQPRLAPRPGRRRFPKPISSPSPPPPTNSPHNPIPKNNKTTRHALLSESLAMRSSCSAFTSTQGRPITPHLKAKTPQQFDTYFKGASPHQCLTVYPS